MEGIIMGFDLNDIHSYSALTYHQLRMQELESFWKRFGCWLAFDAKRWGR